MRRIWHAITRPWLLLALIAGVALALRLVALDAYPPGLYRDEAFNGLDALRVLGGETPLFFEANNGREPLFIYLEAASVGALGRSPGALRLVSALLGTLTVVALYWAGKELFEERVGLLAAALAAVTVWTLNLSRVALRAGSMTPLMAVALGLLWRGLSKRKLGSLVGAGALYALGFYTYLASRVTIIALLLFILYTLLWRREAFWLKGWLAFGGTALVVVAPLGGYFLTHWSQTLGRAEQVSILNPSINQGDLWGTLLRQLGRTLRGFFYRGDFIPRHNVPLRAVFDPLVGAAFLGGVGLAAVRARREPPYALALIWLGTMLLPTILAEDAPHMLRASGILPVLFFLPALGLVALWQVAEQRRWRGAGLAVVLGVLALSAFSSVTAYARHLRSEAVYYNFEAGATQLAVDVNRFLGSGWQGKGLPAPGRAPQAGKQVYLASRLWWNWPSVRFLCPASAVLTVLDEAGQAPRTLAEDTLLVVWPYEDNARALGLLPEGKLISVHEGALERGDLEPQARLLYVTYRAGPRDEAPHNVAAAWQGGIRLVGYHLEALAGQRLQVDLYWETSQPTAVSYTVFCHALRDGASLGGHDGPSAGGYYPTARWRVGEIVQDRHVIALSSPYDTSTCQVEVGLYRLETMQRLALTGPSGQETGQTSIVLH